MATLKDHQQAMVNLLASGSGIPASASRLAHAMHDVLGFLSNETMGQKALDMKSVIRAVEANSPGLNDKALAEDIKALQVNSPAKWPKVTRFDVDIKLADMDEVKTTIHNMQSHLDGARDSQRAAERRVKELENTIRQLKGHNAKLKSDLLSAGERLNDMSASLADAEAELSFVRIGSAQEQSGCRKDDTQVCEHHWASLTRADQLECLNCGVHKP